jgi:hypothetical protein
VCSRKKIAIVVVVVVVVAAAVVVVLVVQAAAALVAVMVTGRRLTFISKARISIGGGFSRHCLRLWA